MLRFLRVRHFALIDQLELHFNPGFNLLSGETGAGKSILVDALGLLAGAKASADTIRTGDTLSISIFEVGISLFGSGTSTAVASQAGEFPSGGNGPRPCRLRPCLVSL